MSTISTFKSFKMMELPEELICEIMQHLPPHDLGNLNRSCRDLYRIGNEDNIWRKKGFLKRSADTAFNGGCSAIPPARLCHSAVIYRKKLYVFGGHNTELDSQRFSEVKNDLHVYEIETKVWSNRPIKNMPCKTEHSTVIHGEKLWMFGGYSGQVFSNTLYYMGITSEKCILAKPCGEIPTGRSAHVGVTCDDKMYIFGGWDGITQNNQLFSLDFETMAWARIHSDIAPLPRCSHAAAVSESRKMLYVFGGYGGKINNYFNDLWAYNFQTQKWIEMPCRGNAPSPRSRMRMIEWDEKLFMFGGWDKTSHFEDLFQYDIASGIWTKMNIGDSHDDSFKIGQHSMTCHDNILYIFGGYNAKLKKSTNDLYSYRLGRSSSAEIISKKNCGDESFEREFKMSKYEYSSQMKV